MSSCCQCPVCRDERAPLEDGSCRRCALRRAAAELLALVVGAERPAGLEGRVKAAADAVREALLAEALAAEGGNRRRAAGLLGIDENRVSALARSRYPWLGRAHDVARGRKPKASAAGAGRGRSE